MDYEKRYNDALERARKIHLETEFDYEKGMMEEIFPELNESEDEKIRKWLIDWARTVNWSGQFTITKEQVIAWLEKQGEQKPTDKVELKTLDPDKVIEWLDEHVPTKFEDMQNYVNQFKKDFGL